MNTARKILKKKANIKVEMDRQLPEEQSDALWQSAEKKLEEILDHYSTLPKGMHVHTDNYIFPAAAVYLAIKEELGREAAFSVIETASIKASTDAGKALAEVLKFPGMPRLFIRVWDPMIRRVFGTANGFRNVFYPKEKNRYRTDIIACPYCRFFTELGCPELTKIFCENDNRVYGNLPGIVFERTGTLGTGADKCDFCVRRV